MRISFRLPDKLAAKLKREAKRQHTTQAALVRYALATSLPNKPASFARRSYTVIAG
jgi:predicted transcriptional regulator